MALAALAATETVTPGRKLASRARSAVVRAGVAAVVASVAVFGFEAPSADAASFDRRIANPHQVVCVGNSYGTTPFVRVTQPYVFGNTSRWETIKWMPYLQRWVPGRGWQHVLRSANWMTFLANRNGTEWYQYTYQPRKFVFENLARGYYYRVIHVVQWSNGELGSMPSDYYLASGHCLL